MPIEINDFEIAKDPSVLILNFLKKEPKKAFSAQEIYEGIPEFARLQIPLDTIKASLDTLYRFYSKVDVAWLMGSEYYKIRSVAQG